MIKFHLLMDKSERAKLEKVIESIKPKFEYSESFEDMVLKHTAEIRAEQHLVKIGFVEPNTKLAVVSEMLKDIEAKRFSDE